MKKKVMAFFAVVMALTVALAVPALAAVESVDVTEVLSSSFETMIGNMMTTAAAVLPICMTVLGLSVTVGFGIKWFKRLTGKA